MKRVLLALCGLFLASPALAQWQVPSGSIPLGRGSGVVGFGTVLGGSGGGTKCLTDTAPPSFILCGAGSAALIIDTTTITGGTPNGLLYNHAGKVGNLATGNNGVLKTDGSGVPSISSTLPGGLTIPTPALGVSTATSINGLTITPTTAGTLTIANGMTLTDTSGIGGSVLLGTVGGGFAAYAGTSCTNQALRALNFAGSGTCASITNAFLTAGTFANITGTGTLTAGATGAGFTIALGSSTITGQLPLTNGGTNASLTANIGGIVYSTASALALLPGTVTAGQCLLSGSSAAPTWGACAGGAAVSSVTNSDGTLTISPTTGAVVSSIALGHFNTWTNKVGITTAVGTLNFDFETTGAVGSGQSLTATQGKIFGGATGAPLTTATPMIAISRNEAISGTDTEGGQNAALWIESVGKNTSVVGVTDVQVNALTSSATQSATGTGDTLAGFFNSTQSGAVGSGNGYFGYGLFAQGVATTPNTNAIGFEVFSSNATGSDYPYTGTYPLAASIHVGGSGTNLSSMGIWFESVSSANRMDVGIVFDTTSTKTASIADFSSATNSYSIRGSHTNGVDTTGCCSGHQIIGTGYSVDNTGVVALAGLSGPGGTAINTAGFLGVGTSTITALFANYTPVNISGSSGASLNLLAGSTSEGRIVADSSSMYLVATGSLVLATGARGVGTVVATISPAGLAVNNGQLSVGGMTNTGSAVTGIVCYNAGTGAITYDTRAAAVACH